MSDQHLKLPSALKHGVYSATDILPGESRAEFEKLHRRIIAELNPAGPLEEQVVYDVARFTWRKLNMLTLRLAERAQQRKAALNSFALKPDALADTELRAELGDYVELIEVGKGATSAGLMQDLKVEDVLDAKIDGALKRLLRLRGIKLLANTRPIESSMLPATVMGGSKTGRVS